MITVRNYPRSDPYWVSGNAEEPRLISYYVALLCYVQPVLYDGTNYDDHDKYLSDLRRQSTVAIFFNKASVLYPNLSHMAYEALKNHRFEGHLHPPPTSRYFRKVAWIIYAGDEFKAECDSAIALIASIIRRILAHRLLLLLQLHKLNHPQSIIAH